ncbi:MAG: DegQ family serine endoprotease [Vicinamibacterales bacterium]
MNIRQFFDSDSQKPAPARQYGRAAAATAAIALAGYLTGFATASNEPGIHGEPVAYAAAAGGDARTVGAGLDSYADVVSRTTPAVVTIRSTRRVVPTQQRLFDDDPIFRRFFGEGDEGGRSAPAPQRQEGLGSGVIVRSDGYVLTNHHVIDGADEITVELSDRRTLKASVVGSDEPSDLAVLKLEGKDFPVLTLADSDAVRVGDVVLALGNPMGVGQTVTMGIISAKGRSTGLGDGSFEDFLQTDAPINRGNSGGALVNTSGQLVGINSQILSPSGGNIGIGFAIPANLARNVMDSLIENGRVHRGMIGVTVQTVTPELAKSLQLDSINGALVSDVKPDGPAANGGVKRGDVITGLDEAPIGDSNALRNHVAQLKPGSKVQLHIVRSGHEQTLSVTLDELPSKSASAAPGSGGSAPEGAAGLSVQPLTPDVAKRMDVDADSGLVVTNVDPDGTAAEAGFRRGDVIQEVDGVAVSTPSALREQLKKAGSRPALVLVQREGATIFLPLARS